jgi:hypothetical protein
MQEALRAQLMQNNELAERAPATPAGPSRWTHRHAHCARIALCTRRSALPARGSTTSLASRALAGADRARERSAREALMTPAGGAPAPSEADAGGADQALEVARRAHESLMAEGVQARARQHIEP